MRYLVTLFFAALSFNAVGQADVTEEGGDIRGGGEVVGCMDAVAANFDPNATIDSGLCVYCDPGTFVLTLNMSDSNGDGWNGAVYYVFNQVTGELMLSGDLDSAFTGDGLSSGADLVCLAPGCYSVQVSSGSAPSEVNVSMSDQFGTNYGSTGGGYVWPLDFTLTGACAFSGCTSSSALNYNISATIDDGSCMEPPASPGCNHENACNYNPDATEDDGSCIFEVDECGVCGGPGIPAGECDCEGNVLDECGVCGGDGIPAGECDCYGNVVDECGVCSGDGIAEGVCDCNGNAHDAIGVCGGACSADEDADGVCDDIDDCIGEYDICAVCNGTNECIGCGQVLACNYDPNALFIDNSLCEFESCYTFGCTDYNACNFSEAIIDDGSCLFTNESCDDDDEATLNDTIQEDCSCSGVISTVCVASECCISGTQWDLNTMTCVYEDACSADIAKDGFVAVDDLLELLSAFGSSCDEVATGIGGEECVGAECCGENTIWCETLEICIPFISCPADLNDDESVGSFDLLVFLPFYGGDCEEYESLPDCEVTASPWICGDLIEHEGYDYSTVLIGEQCWFSENCRYLPVVSPSSEGSETDPYYYVYDYQGTDVGAAQATDNYETYGVLYNWPAVMTEGICPSGWHVPSDGEFTQLTDFLGGEGVAGGKMKEAGYDHWHSPNTGATNSSGWTGLPGGLNISGSFGDGGNGGNWWSASESGSYSWRLKLFNSYDDVAHYDNNRNLGFSARCVRD